MDTVYNTGQTELIMKATGCLTKQKGKVLSGMPKVMYIEVNSKMIWPMDMENILILMDQNIKESLEMTYKKDTERKNGLMELNTLEVIRME